MTYLDSIFTLNGKVAVVTGGNQGIGHVISLGLAKAGAEIAILSRSSAEDTIAAIEKDGGKAYHIPTDVTKEAQVDAAMDEIVKRSGSIDIVFNNAGVTSHDSTLNTSTEDFRKVIEINLTGEYSVARAAAKIMVEKNIQGSIINMASMSGSIVNIPQFQGSYNSSKAAVIHMTRSMAVEWAQYGIRVNSLSPGYIATPMSVNVSQELKDAWMPLIPMHRMGKPEELIPVVLFLACDASGYITGSDIIVDGGYTCL